MSDDDLARTGPVTPDQMRAARALLGWSQTQLGLRSDTSAYVVKKFELTGQIASVRGRSDLTDPLAAIRVTLEAAGVEFANGEVSGVAAAETTPITPGQVKAARKLLGWSRTQLGVRSDTSIHVVQTFERTGHVAILYCRRTEQVDTVAAIRVALEEAGVEFTDEDTLGTRLRNQGS